MSKSPIAANEVPVRQGPSVYPGPFAELIRGRHKRKLGDFFALENFGVNLTELEPGAISALKHHHARQDEFIYILSGNPTLRWGDETYELGPGDCCGFRAGDGIGHQLENRTSNTVTYLEVGDRIPGDSAEYPDDDLMARQTASGEWKLTRKDGTEY